MSEAPWITPQTDGQLTITVEQPDGTLRDDATVTATVYSPRGTVLATNLPMVALGGGTGQYVLTVDADWSEVSGKAVEGEYVAKVKAVRAGAQTVTKFRYTVRFTDDD